MSISHRFVETNGIRMHLAEAVFRPLMAQPPQTIRGLEQPIAVWTQARAGE